MKHSQEEQPLWRLGVHDLAQAYRSGAARPSDACESVLARLDAVDPKLNLFACVDRDGLMEAARASDLRHAAGKSLGPLDGVPVTIKDNIDVKGMPTAWGSRLFLDNRPADDDIPVARLRAAGALLVGKTCVAEFTLGNGNVSTPAFGVTRNPYDPARTTGASTGGGAGATAAGIGAIALGTDGGGSIRRPSGYNNLVGLKPSMGRVARLDGLPPLLYDFEVIGPLARSVDDIAAAMRVIEGADPRDRLSLRHGIEPATGEARTGRILAVSRIGDIPVDDEITVSFRATVAKMRSLGHEVIEDILPISTAEFDEKWPRLGATALAWMLKDTEWQDKIGWQYPPMIERGNGISGMDLYDLLLLCRKIYGEFHAIFERFDFVMTPTAGAMQWKAEDIGPRHHRAFTGFVNAAGLPAIAIPGDPSPGGLPIGFQVIAPMAQDWKLIALARSYELDFPWAGHLPPL